MRILLLWVGITSAIAENEVQLKHGALLENKGNVKMIENIVIIKKNMTKLLHCQERANEMIKVVDNILEKEKDEENKELLEDLKINLKELTGNRKKRSLLPFVGNILNGLFGVARESDVEREKERIDKIEHWANDMGHVINQFVSELNDHAQAFNEVVSNLIIIEKKIEKEINQVERKLSIQEIVMKMDKNILNIKNLLESWRLAHLGNANVNLISIKELEDVIKYSIVEFGFQPLDVDIVTYYSMLMVKVVGNTCYIFLPFNNENEMKMKNIIPFPMIIEGESVKLQGKKLLVLEQRENDLICIWESKELQKCLEFKPREYICNNPEFFLQPLESNKCIKFILNGGEDHCLYEHVEQTFHVEFLNDIYVYTKNKENVKVHCKDNETSFQVQNVKVLPKNCKIKIQGLFYYKPTVFQNVNINVKEGQKDFDLKLSEFSIKTNQIKVQKMQPYESKFLLMYKDKVMPWMTISYLPFFVCTIVASYCILKVLILNRIKNINSMLKQKIQE